MTLLSLGVAGAVGANAIARIAAATEAAGFSALWVNDTPDGDSLAALAAAAEHTSTLVLATGVIPLDRRPAGNVIDVVQQLPQQRVVVGVGSGQRRPGALVRVREGVERLRGGLTARVMVGALGPRMRQLAASASNGPLLSWLTPEVATQQSAEAHVIGPATHTALYVRTALDAEAVPRLEQETARYAQYPAYAAHFERVHIAPEHTVIGPGTPRAVVERYRSAVDEVVLRAITPTDAVSDYVRFVESAAERFLR